MPEIERERHDEFEREMEARREQAGILSEVQKQGGSEPLLPQCCPPIRAVPCGGGWDGRGR